MKSRATKKFGTDRPTTDETRSKESVAVPRLIAEAIPMTRPMLTAMMIASTATRS